MHCYRAITNPEISSDNPALYNGARRSTIFPFLLGVLIGVGVHLKHKLQEGNPCFCVNSLYDVSTCLNPFNDSVLLQEYKFDEDWFLNVLISVTDISSVMDDSFLPEAKSRNLEESKPLLDTRIREIKKHFNSLLIKIDGLYSVVVSDRDGVPILKASSDKAPESVLRPSFLSTFGMATDQGSKLGLGRNNAVICIYTNYQVVQMNDLPLIVSFISSHDCNTGHILSQKQTLHQLLQSLKGSVVEH